MKFAKRLLPLVALIFILSSCFHAKVTTDKTPSAQKIEKQWASGFLFGLIGPSPVDAAQKCENGVAKVETELSFLNQIVSSITFNLYTPMTIEVTCASGSSMSAIELQKEGNMAVAQNASRDQVAQTMQEAADKSAQLHGPVYVKLQ